jgi:predicted dinucleotide-binding enzyme
MKIGIIGSGNIGATAAKLFANAGHEVAICYKNYIIIITFRF